MINVKVNGSYLEKDSAWAGVQHEANAKTLRIEFDEGWDGYAKTVTFWDALGENPVKRTLTADLLEDLAGNIRIYLCKIPGEAMTEAGKCTFVIDGYLEGTRQRSIEDKLKVAPAGYEEEAGEPADPTPSQAEQLQGQIENILQDMSAEADRAEASADSAEKDAYWAKSYAEGRQEDVWAYNLGPGQIGFLAMGGKLLDAGRSYVVTVNGETGVFHMDMDTGTFEAFGLAFDERTVTNNNSYSVDVSFEPAEGYEGSITGAKQYAEQAAASAEAAANAEGYAEQAAQSAAVAQAAQATVAENAEKAEAAAGSAKADADRAEAARTGIETAASTATTAASNAEKSAQAAANSAGEAQTSAQVALDAANNAKSSMNSASQSATNAARSETEAMRYSKIAQTAVDKVKGDMLQSVYDPQGKKTDIFAYTDTKIAAIPAPDVSGAVFMDGTESLLPGATQWRRVMYGGGVFVAIPMTTASAPTDVAAYSTDGRVWKETKLPASARWDILVYGDGKFVAASRYSQDAAYSEDGRNWTAVTSMPIKPRVMAYGAGKFVALPSGDEGLAYSTDGITWVSADLPLLGYSDNYWVDVTFGNDMFFACAEEFAAYSVDGLNWTATYLPWHEGSSVSDVVYSTDVILAADNGMFLATTKDSAYSAYSYDCITWHLMDMPNDAQYWKIAYGNGVFVAASRQASNLIFAYSANGLDWSEADSLGVVWYDVAFGTDCFVAVSPSTNKFAVSKDGANWAFGTAPSLVDADGVDITGDVRSALGISAMISDAIGTTIGGGSGGGVFLAVYNETSYEDVLAAYNEGKMIFCKDTRTSYSFENIYVLTQYMTGSGFTFTQADTGLTYGRSSYYINPLKVLTLSVSNGWHEPATAKPYLPAIYMDGADGNEYMITVNASGQLVATAT